MRVDLATRVADVTRLADFGAPTARGADMAGIQAVLGDLLEAMAAVVGADGGILHLYDAPSDDLFAQVATRSLGEVDGAPRVQRGEGAVGAALDRLAPVSAALDGLSAADHRWLRDVRLAYCAPVLTLTREPMGVVTLLFRRPAPPDVREEALIAAFADQAAEMVERAHLHSEARALLLRDHLRSSQLAQLADAARGLMGELVLDDLLRTVADAARAIIGAHQAVASRLVRGWTEAFTAVSLSEKYARWRTYDRVPKGLGVLNYVTRENKPLRLSPDELVAHPEWRGMRDAPDHPPLPNYLAAPLVARDGRNLGLIQLSDKALADEDVVGDFTAEDENLLVALAQLASAAIENLELRDRERLAGQRVDASARSLKLLSDASRALAETLEVDATLSTITSLAVPVLGDWCGVHLLDPAGELALAAHAAEVKAMEDVLSGLARQPRGADGIALEQALAGGVTRRITGLPSAVLEELHSRLPDRAVDPGTVLMVPLTAHGRRLGTLTLVRIPGPPYTDGEAELAEELGRRAALAVDNATRYSSERDTALLLQRSMLPDLPPFATGLRVASRYLPGAEGLNVGGDWYDLIPLADGRHGLVVGDVAGRGIAAAAGMGQLRAVVRAYALEGHSPARLLEHVDRFVAVQRTASFVTCLYAVIDTSARTLTVASAGHLPPLLLDDRGARFVSGPTGAPLGTSFGGFADVTIELEPGTTVLLYTDGLVEERTRSIDEGLATLRMAASRWRHSPDALCDGVLVTMARQRPLEDDTAVLAVSLDTSLVGGEICQRRCFDLPSQPSSARVARSALADLLRECDADAQVDIAELLVTEVVANAVRHAGGERIDLDFVVDDAAVRVEVGDEGDGDPVPGPPPGAEDAGGRGLMIVEGLASRWGYERRPQRGKRVWFEVDR